MWFEGGGGMDRPRFARSLRETMARLMAICILAAVVASSIGCARSDEDRDDAFLDDGRTLASDADADPYTGPAPLTVRFTAKTINVFGKVSYRWNFDDRTTSTEQNPTHTFPRQGWYRVTLDARDAGGHTDRTNLLLHVWRPRDWARMQRHRDMRIVSRSLRELKRKNEEPMAPPPVVD
jgi:hypothetical protein